MKLSDSGIPVIKAVYPERPGMDKLMKSYRGVVQLFLYDSYAKGYEDTGLTAYGGTGKKFDWGVLKEPSEDLSFFLGGGIGPADAEVIRGLEYRGLNGVDVNSRFERYPGNKDVMLLRDFIGSIRK
jgi:phosphoribosylanthranilate isomerase